MMSLQSNVLYLLGTRSKASEQCLCKFNFICRFYDHLSKTIFLWVLSYLKQNHAMPLQDREALMKLLTFESVEEMVRKRVEKKAKVFGREVSLDHDHDETNGKYKVDPSVVSLLYVKWVMPLTKLVQVEYLLRRLDWRS